MKKVVTVGVFDFFHLGHLRLFKQAKELGDYLIVAVQDGDFILKTKPNATVLYTTEQRVEMVSNIKCVDEVRVYQDVDAFLPTVSFDVFAKGPDQVHLGFQNAVRWCEENSKQVVVLPRTECISSSGIKSGLVQDLLYAIPKSRE